MEPESGFESGLIQLQQTVTALESGTLGLDAALAHYETGIRLLAQCHGLLAQADRKVALLTGVSDDGTPATAPFDASATFDGTVKPSRPVLLVADGNGLDDLPF